jgi:hypothetical protein
MIPAREQLKRIPARERAKEYLLENRWKGYQQEKRQKRTCRITGERIAFREQLERDTF